MSYSPICTPMTHDGSYRAGYREIRTLIEDDREVKALVRDIRRIGRQLRNHENLNHPYVRKALSHLDRQLASTLDKGQGRHRAQPGKASAYAGGIVPDTWGYSLKPNPLTASTADELITALRLYRAWAGNPSFRQMAMRTQYEVAHSTMCTVLKGSKLPRLKAVTAIVAGCGGSPDDQERFATAWRRIQSGRLESPPLRIVPARQ